MDSDDPDKKSVFELIGISEEEAREVDRKFRHIMADWHADGLVYHHHLMLRAFPDLSKEDKFLCFLYGTKVYQDGYEQGLEDGKKLH